MPNNPLIILYGESALEEGTKIIRELATQSNFKFDAEYNRIGINFTMINANEIIENKRKEMPLKELITKSFGEAAIYYFQ